MAGEALKIHRRPRLRQPRMLLGFSGWMDGGDVSTGTVGWLARSLRARRLAEIDPSAFYIYNFPGSMEVSALFRPHTKMEDGLVKRLDYPKNAFYSHGPSDLILFEGKEPNVRWGEYAECILTVAELFNVGRIYFVGSVAGVVPHTRAPRLSCSVSQASLREEMRQYGVRFSGYEGPASIVTALTHLCAQRGREMVSLVAEIPAYVQGPNLVCIESVARRVAGILGLQVSLEELREARDAFEKRLDEAVGEREELVELIEKLESDYDNEVFDTQMGDLKQWLEQRGIRLD
jgi:proteasome assembly chaperone (PAC2) family protein